MSAPGADEAIAWVTDEEFLVLAAHVLEDSRPRIALRLRAIADRLVPQGRKQQAAAAVVRRIAQPAVLSDDAVDAILAYFGVPAALASPQERTDAA